MICESLHSFSVSPRSVEIHSASVCSLYIVCIISQMYAPYDERRCGSIEIDGMH